jgi:glycosyltransferase involved in cell wall biosynthesis
VSTGLNGPTSALMEVRERAGGERDDGPWAGQGDGRRVFVFARKILVHNTRIFKQARSLTNAGYDVTLIGILPRDGAVSEQRDGYRIVRLPLDPLYARVPRRIRRGARAVNRVIVHLPFRYLRTVLRARRFVRRTFILIRRTARRVLIGGLETVGLDGAAERAGVALLEHWRALVERLADAGPAEPSSDAHGWASALLFPLIVVFRLLHLAGNGVHAVYRGVRRLRGRRLGFAAMRWLVRREERAMRWVSELAVRTVTSAMRPVAWPLKSVEFYKQVHRAVTRELGAPDVIQANDLDTLWIASVLARRYDIPLVYDAQELYIGLHTLPLWYRKFLAVQERILIRRAQRTIVVNDAIRDVMERKYRVEIDTVVLNCPPLVEDLADTTAPTVRELFGIPDDELVLLYSGALGPDRGLANTVRALEHVDNASLVLLGEGALREELSLLAVSKGLESRIFFADFVHHLDVPSFISSADIGVIPYENVGINHYLCSPSKLFHYIMAGLPIACSDFPFLRKVVIENGLGAVFDPADPVSIAAAVRELGHSPQKRADCERRLRVARETFCWEEQEKRFMAVYGSLPRQLVGANPERMPPMSEAPREQESDR